MKFFKEFIELMKVDKEKDPNGGMEWTLYLVTTMNVMLTLVNIALMIINGLKL